MTAVGSRRLTVVLGLAAVLLAATAWNGVYVLGQGWQGVVVRLGRPVTVIQRAGLYGKAPFAEQVVRLDGRDQPLDGGAQQVVLADQSRLLVQPVMRYRIVDPLRFYRATGAGRVGDVRLKAQLNAALRQVLAGAAGRDMVAAHRDALMTQVRDAAAPAAQGLGVQIADVRLLRASLTDADAQFVYRRIAAGEVQQAAQLRSQGEQRRRDGMAAADRDAALVRAQATAQAATIRDQGEAARAAILAKAYAADPAFGRVYDTLDAYRAALGNGNTTLVLTPGSGFLRDFGAPAGGK